MPHKLVAVLIIFGTIALMVAWIPCVDCTTRFCQYVYDLFGRAPDTKGAVRPVEQPRKSVRKAA